MSEFLDKLNAERAARKAKVEDLEGQANLKGYKFKVSSKETSEGQVWTVVLTSLTEGHTFSGTSGRYSNREDRYLDALTKAVDDMKAFVNRLD